MKKKILFLTIAFVLVFAGINFYSGKTYHASRVVDGDTFVLSSGEKVRLIGIDTPEKGEELYEEASERLESLIIGKELKLKKDVSETDRYGRLLRYVYAEDVFVNAVMVEEGYASAFRYEPDVRYADYFSSLESDQ